jgi:transcription elongation factor Elf1
MSIQTMRFGKQSTAPATYRCTKCGKINDSETTAMFHEATKMVKCSKCNCDVLHSFVGMKVGDKPVDYANPQQHSLQSSQPVAEKAAEPKKGEGVKLDASQSLGKQAVTISNPPGQQVVSQTSQPESAKKEEAAPVTQEQATPAPVTGEVQDPKLATLLNKPQPTT